MSDPNLGLKLANRYELVELLGQGAMGRVYLAEDTLLGGVMVAVKFLAQTLLNKKMRDRFVQEATTCAQLGQKSIHVVRVTDYGVSEDEVPFYVMEYLQGDNLSKIINPKPLPVPRFLGLCRQICLGLQSAHDGIRVKGYDKPVSIIHRDIKPSNILITQDPTLGELAKILDFGIAKLLQADIDQTSSFMGTLAYASPEQMEGRELDNRSDIYSMGIMMFQMLTSRIPLTAESHTFGGWYKAHHSQPPKAIHEVTSVQKVPKLLEDLIMACLAKDPKDRPQTVGDIIKALEPLDQRFGTGFRIGQRIGATLSRVPVVKKNADSTLTEPQTEDDICRLTSWPKNKPIAEIVFPYPLPTSKRTLATLWVMLPQVEVDKRLLGSRYNNFICTMSPHPMALWLTVLYNAQHGPRWLPCYLDLKTKAGQEMGFLLGQVGQYKILFFAKENPQRCAHVVSANIANPQRKLLQEWVMAARSHPSVGNAADSKDVLKRELTTSLKPKILKQLEALHEN
ncbi:serine/threonine protein kinase [Leptolyngbya sp. PCC 6406]|uniref:serine/threonine protein kinase n=1 Tax=Leptolyngbya sp. PCC 6406 TaxID=1173264 RepID=UPI0002ABB366|nr:serine/threonine-protein kinase [Leptolyngbya sp. PCC 6406]